MGTWLAGDLWDPSNPENRDRTRTLQGELRGILMRWDPIGVAGAPEAADEYDCMISPLMHRLHRGASDTELAVWLKAEVEQHFGLTPTVEREEALASSLAAWWSAATSS